MKSNFLKKRPKDLNEGNKPLVQWKALGNHNKPWPPLLVYEGWIVKDSLFVVALHVVLPFLP
jgi:hypothetical protein